MEAGERACNVLMASPAMVAASVGEDEAFEARSSFSANAARSEFMFADGVEDVLGDDLEANAFIIVCRGMSVLFTLFLCARNAFGKRSGLDVRDGEGRTFAGFADTIVIKSVGGVV